MKAGRGKDLSDSRAVDRDAVRTKRKSQELSGAWMCNSFMVKVRKHDFVTVKSFDKIFGAFAWLIITLVRSTGLVEPCGRNTAVVQAICGDRRQLLVEAART